MTFNMGLGWRMNFAAFCAHEQKPTVRAET